MGILVACTAENSDSWYREVYDLVLSVRRFGGSLRDAPFVACFVDGVEPRYAKGLAELGADVEVVPRFDPRNPPSNKLGMLDVARSRDAEVLLMMDTDIVVVGDLSRYLVPGSVTVKPENADPYGPDVWRAVYRELGIAEPARSMVTTSSSQVSHPYFNTGVLFVPGEWCGRLRDAWAANVHACLDLYQRRPGLVPPAEEHWTNQVAFALTMVAEGIPQADLPVAGNLSTTAQVSPLFAHQVTPPFALNYHNEIDAEGYLFRSPNARLNPLLDAFNRELAATRGTPYGAMPQPPVTRRALRRLEGHDWYESGPVARLRRHPGLAPLRRQAKRLAKGAG